MSSSNHAHNARDLPDAEASRDLAAAEKKAARRMELGGHLWVLLAALVLFVIYLVTPHAGDVRGYEVVLRLPAAVDGDIKITEYVYAWLSALGIGVFTTLTLITRRTVFGLIAWMLTTVALIFSLLALWLRQTRSVADQDMDMSVGFFLSLIGVALAVYSYSRIALRRSPEQAQLAEARAQDENLDEVGYLQREAMTVRQHTSFETNPLFVDDRRQRATERYLASRPDADRPEDEPDQPAS